MDERIFKEVPAVVHDAVVNTLDSLEERPTIPVWKQSKKSVQRGRFHMSVSAAACLACFLIAGITVSAVGIVNLYRQRMEAMDENQIEEYYEIALNGEATDANRGFTVEEQSRYEELKKEYEQNGLFPESQLHLLQEGDTYDGNGVVLDSATRTLYLPDEALTDEELLQIIDFHHKIEYSIYQTNQERILNGGGWESRMTLLTDAEVDEVYLIWFGARTGTSGGYNRQLTEDEEGRYEELLRQYEEEGLYTTLEIAVIQTPEEYTGEGIAFCAGTSSYYIPERELTDEELLQIIDYDHMARYCISRIGDEVQMGLRDGYPSLED